MRLVDAFSLCVCFLLVAWVREYVGGHWGLDLIPGSEPVLQKVTVQNQIHLVVQIILIWMLSLHLNGAYDDARRIRADVLLLRLARAVSFAVVGLIAVQFIVQPAIPTSRSFLLGFAATSVPALHLARLGWLRWGANREPPYYILVVGTANEAIPFLTILSRHRDWGMRVAGVLRPKDDTLSPIEEEVVLGNVPDLPRVL